MASAIVELTRNKTAKFVYAGNGALYYAIELFDASDFIFPIPFEDTKGARFGAEENAGTLRRWIRQQLEFLEEETGSKPEFNTSGLGAVTRTSYQ
jgi:hypothetical protein